MSVVFVLREEVLEPTVVVGIGPAAHALAMRLFECDDDRLGELFGVAGDGIVAALGPASALPWADGVAYLGQDPDAPRLLLPTNHRPAVPLNVFERAILDHSAPLGPPLAVLASVPRVFSLADALPIRRDRLRDWIEWHG